MSTCPECWEDTSGCTCEERKEIEQLQAQVERLEEIIRINGICPACGDGLQDWEDEGGKFTCKCKAKAKEEKS